MTLQVLRGLAALIVVFGHVALHVSYRFSVKPLPRFIDGGGIGVDIFFCLSGFIMYYTSHLQIGVRGAAAEFLTRRLLRIYPLYWVVSLLAMLVEVLDPRMVSSWGQSPTFVLKSLLLLPQNGPPLIVSAWTLVHEVKFYAIFAALMLFPQRLARVGLAGWMAGSFGVLLLSMFGIDWLDRSLVGRAVNYIWHPASLEFGAGIVAAWVVLHVRTAAWVDVGIVALGLVAVVLLMQFNSFFMPDTKYFAVIMYAVPTFLLVLGATLVERRWHPVMPRLLTFLGDASYSTYLTHLVLIPTLVWHAIPAGASKGLCTLLTCAFGVGLHIFGALTYWSLEAPMHRWSREWARRWWSKGSAER
jgi:exopolysaccharide production protein ExoZ